MQNNMAELTHKSMELIIEAQYKEYVASQVGKAIAKNAPEFWEYSYKAEACGIAKKLHEEYDVGIAIATDGLFLGYIAQQFGFPVLNVKMGRRLNGATWHPLDDINEDNIGNKRVIVFDNDVVTGRTLRRATREINKLNPQYTDLLLVYAHTIITPEHYSKWEKFISKDVKILSRLHNGNLMLDTLCQIPDGFRKVKILKKDFKPDEDALTEFEQKVVSITK